MKELDEIQRALEDALPAGDSWPQAFRIGQRLVAPLLAGDGRTIVGAFLIENGEERLVRNGVKDPGRLTLRWEALNPEGGTVAVMSSYKAAIGSLPRTAGAVVVTADVRAAAERLRKTHPRVNIHMDVGPSSTKEGNGDGEPEPLFPVEEARFARFLASDPPARRWLLRAEDDGILPLGVVGILASMGGAGKSQLVYQMGVSVTAGLPFLGWKVDEPGGFLYVAGEDDDPELHRRGHLLVSHYARWAKLVGEPFDQEAVGERLHVVSRVAADNLLTRADAGGEVHPTAVVDRLIRSATEIPDLRVVVLDPASRFKGGKANHEEDATRFVEVAERICEATGATVLVTEPPRVSRRPRSMRG